MPIDSLYEDSTPGFLTGQNQANVPEPKPPKPGTSISSIARAVGRGVAQGGATLYGAGADIGSAVGQLTTGERSMQFDPVQLANDDQATNAQLAKTGRLFQSAAGTNAYNFADTMKPDPTSTTTIDQIVQGAVSGLTQLVPAAVVAGPAGVIAGGASIGLGKAEELKRQNVDVGTRTAIGGIEGVAAAGGAVLPVAGSTIARTAALVAAGGPGVAVTQAVAEKAILKNANYDHLADQIDPLDPVNLAASTIIPGVFGAAHMIGASRAAAKAAGAAPTPSGPAAPLAEMTPEARKALPYNAPSLDAYATQVAQANGVPPAMLLFIKNSGERSNSNQVSPAGAKGVMQFMPDTFAQYGKGDATDPINSIDAAGKYAADLLKRYNGDTRAALTEYNGGVKQAQEVHAGGVPAAAETKAYLDRYDTFAANHDISNMSFNPHPEQVDAALLATSQRIVDDAHIGDDVASMSNHQSAFELAARQMDEGQPVDVSSILPGGLTDDVLSRYSKQIEAARSTDEAAKAYEPDRNNIVPERDSLMTAVAKLGGVNSAEIASALGRSGEEASWRHGIKRASTREGMSVDEMAQALKERGYLTSDDPHNELLDKMDEGFNDVHHFTPEAEIANRQKLDADQHFQNLLDQAHDVYRRLPTAHQKLVAEEHGNGALSIEEEAYLARHYGEQDGISHAELEHFGHDAEGGSVAKEGGQHDAAGAAGGDTGVSPAQPREPGSDDHLEQSVRQTALEQPDTIVHLDANEGPKEGTIEEMLKTIDKEHANTLADAKLFEVAANCFIKFGDV